MVLTSIALVVGSRFFFHSKFPSTETKPVTSQNPKPTPVVVKDLINYQMVPANNKEYSYPLIKDYPNKVIMEKVNKTLSENFKDSGCDSTNPEDNSDWNVKISVDYAQNDIFSVNESGDYYCGGPYPTNNYSNTLTFDMKTGEQITFEKLFKNYEKDKEQINTNIYSNITNSDCGDVTPESLVDFSQDYRISSKTRTIKVRPELPHVIEACIEEAEVPIKKLSPFIDTTSILNRI